MKPERKTQKLRVPREEIPWYPTIDKEKCLACGECFRFCPRSVYTWDSGPVVTNPYNCVVLCSGCVPKCTAGAILFPRREDFVHYVL